MEMSVPLTLLQVALEGEVQFGRQLLDMMKPPGGL